MKETHSDDLQAELSDLIGDLIQKLSEVYYYLIRQEISNRIPSPTFLSDQM